MSFISCLVQTGPSLPLPKPRHRTRVSPSRKGNCSLSAAAVTARWTEEGRVEWQGGSYEAMETVKSIMESPSSEHASAEETITSSNQEQIIIQEESSRHVENIDVNKQLLS